MSDIYIAVLVALFVIILTFLLSKKFRRRTNVVLLTGLSDSGKTALFAKLIFNKPKKSVTSLKENEAFISQYNLKLLDLPGTDRLRSRFWDQYRGQACHVVFILDASKMDEKLRDLSEYLYTLLSDGIVYKNRIKFTIACNKQDLEGALRMGQLKTILENELTAIKKTKTGQLAKASNEEEDDYLARLDSEEISFDKLKVNFIETSVQNPEQLIKTIF